MIVVLLAGLIALIFVVPFATVAVVWLVTRDERHLARQMAFEKIRTEMIRNDALQEELIQKQLGRGSEGPFT